MDTIRKTRLSILTFITVVLLMFAHGIKAETIDSVFITRDGFVSSTQLNINLNETKTIKFGYKLLPIESSAKNVSWKLELENGTDSSSFARVDNTGTVTFFKVTERNNPLMLTCTVDNISSRPVEINVTEPGAELKGISPRLSTVYVDENTDEIDLYQNLIPVPGEATVYTGDCIFSSSESEFKVDRTTGILTIPDTPGLETIISVEYIANPQLTTSFNVIISEPVAASDIQSDESVSIPTEKTCRLNVRLLPENNTESLESKIDYESSNPNVASVDQYGNVMGISLGSTEITASATIGGTKKLTRTHVDVIQNVPVESIAIDDSEIDLTTEPNGTSQKQLQVYFAPENTTERHLSFTSLAPNVANVTPEGLIIAQNEGRTTITIQDERDHIVVLTVNVSSSPVVAEYTTVTAHDPDEFTVIIKNVHTNKALCNSNVEIEKISCFAFSDNTFADLDAKVMQKASNTNDWVAVFPINGLGENNYFKDASQIKLHLYAKANGTENFMGVTNYNYTNHGTVPTNITVTPYAENIGFITPSVGQDSIAGTIAESRHLEGIRISTPIENLGLNYSVHAQNLGWLEEVSQGTYAGTIGQDRQIEAIKISLTQEASILYTIQYRAHCSDIGWTQWVRDGEVAGTVGENRQLEAVQIRIIKK